MGIGQAYPLNTDYTLYRREDSMSRYLSQSKAEGRTTRSTRMEVVTSTTTTPASSKLHENVREFARVHTPESTHTSRARGPVFIFAKIISMKL